MPQARQRPGTVLAVAMPVSRSVAGMVMLAGPGKHLTHASQHPSDDALQHVTTTTRTQMQDGRNAAGGHPRTGQETLPPYRRSSPPRLPARLTTPPVWPYGSEPRHAPGLTVAGLSRPPGSELAIPYVGP